MQAPLSNWTRWREIALAVTGHFRSIAERDGYFRVAMRLKKQGIPLNVALLILTGRKPR